MDENKEPTEWKLRSEWSTLASRVGEPSGLGCGRQSWRDDAAGLADGKERVPAVRRDNAATMGSEKARFEVEGPEEMAFGIREWNSDGPSDKFGRIGGSIRRNELDGAKLHDAVERAEREAVPLGPPTTQRVTRGLVGRMLEQELDMVNARGGCVDAVGVKIGHSRVDAN